MNRNSGFTVHGLQLTVDQNIKTRGSVVRTQVYISCEVKDNFKFSILN